MADYSQYSAPSAEWTQFEKTWTPPSPPPASATVYEVRDAVNARTAEHFANVIGRPEDGLRVADVQISTSNDTSIPARLYQPLDKYSTGLPPLYISFHAGGFHLGNLETEDPHCRRVCLATGFCVLNVNYRHTPEWTFPAPVDDAWAAFKWSVIRGHKLGFASDRIFLGGVSAGALLAINVALRALKQDTLPQVQGIILSTPSTVHPDLFPFKTLKDGRGGSLVQNKDAPFINLAKLRKFVDMYKADPAHPECSPLLLPRENLKGLCPVEFHVAGLDPLRDEGILLADRIRDGGTEVTIHIYPGLPHAFMNLPTLPSAKLWLQREQETLRAWASRSP